MPTLMAGCGVTEVANHCAVGGAALTCAAWRCRSLPAAPVTAEQAEHAAELLRRRRAKRARKTAPKP